MINEALKAMIKDHYGEDIWRPIATQIDIEYTFLRMSQYPDSITYKLVAATADALGKSTAEVLEEFGDYWIDFAFDAYGDLLAISGETFIELIENLNSLHTRVGQMMPDLKPPTFLVTKKTEASFVLLYYSDRQGLWPMIIGLLQGLGRHFHTQLEISHRSRLPSYPDHEVFFVNYHADKTANE